jgi:GNAT superfamily N-acetyltransferase
MPDLVAEVLRSAAGRWQQVDQLLPDPRPPTGHGHCGIALTVPVASGRAAAVGWCRHLDLKPDAEELAWGAAAQFWLTARIAGDPGEPGIGPALDELLSRWRAHLATVPDAAGEDTEAGVRWPSRDVGGVRALLRHGLQPLSVIAARPAGRAVPEAAPPPAGLQIRLAGPADVAAVTALTLEVIRFDQYFGSVLLRPHADRAEREGAERVLARPDPWTWLAERDGQPVGLLSAEPPEHARWIAGLASRGPVAYLGTMSVLPGERGSGVGTAMVAELHRRLDASAVAVTLLHHGQLNPLSTPFWSRMGYRPLWTSWEIRPALALR